MNTIAVIGAGGFVGSHLIESLILDGVTDYYAIARSYQSLARLSRFGPALNIRVADATDTQQLGSALTGCTTAINLVSGHAQDIVDSTKAIYDACRQSSVKRLIHISSAVIYGHVQTPGMADDAPPEPELTMPYAIAKAESEHFLRDQMHAENLEVIVLRPGIIWGPRSPWSYLVARDLCDQTAYLIGDDGGICNTIYIDNLVSSIITCCAHKGECAGFYNISDQETVTWQDVYASLADFYGYDMSAIIRVTDDHFRPTRDMQIQGMMARLNKIPTYQWCKSRINDDTKSAVKKWIGHLGHMVSPPAPPGQKAPQPTITREMWDLQHVRYKLPNDRFCTHFNYHPPIRFDEGTQRTINWLTFAGLA